MQADLRKVTFCKRSPPTIWRENLNVRKRNFTPNRTIRLCSTVTQSPKKQHQIPIPSRTQPVRNNQNTNAMTTQKAALVALAAATTWVPESSQAGTAVQTPPDTLVSAPLIRLLLTPYLLQTAILQSISLLLERTARECHSRVLK